MTRKSSRIRRKKITTVKQFFSVCLVALIHYTFLYQLFERKRNSSKSLIKNAKTHVVYSTDVQQFKIVIKLKQLKMEQFLPFSCDFLGRLSPVVVQ